MKMDNQYQITKCGIVFWNLKFIRQMSDKFCYLVFEILGCISCFLWVK